MVAKQTSRRYPQWRLSSAALLMAALLLLSGAVSARQFLTVERVSITSGGAEIVNAQRPAISQDGRYVAFWTDANGVVAADDTNNQGDVYVHDRSTNETVRVSIGNGNVQGNNVTFNELDISGSGTLIAMTSAATNFVTGDTNNAADIYVFDRGVGAMARVSLSYTGAQANGASSNPVISQDGRFVLFRSAATNLIANDTNAQPDLYLYDRVVNPVSQIARVNVASDDAQSNQEDPNSQYDMNGDGTVIVFDSIGSTLVPNDTNNTYDIFLRDRLSDVTSRISVGANAVQGNGASTSPVISADGRYVAYSSAAANLVTGDTNGVTDIFLYDRITSTTTRVSITTEGTQANGKSSQPEISGNGRYVSFASDATNLVPDDTNGVTDIFVHDTETGITTRVNVDSGGQQAVGAAAPLHSMSSGGQAIAFESAAANLVPNDTNNSNDVFVAVAGPAAPSDLTATAVSETRIDLAWTDNAQDETRYMVERRRGSNAWRFIAENLPTSTVAFSDTGLNTCTTYSYRVYAADATGRSPSSIVTETTLGCPPAEFTLRRPRNEDVIVNPAAVDELRWDESREAQTYAITLTRTAGSPLEDVIKVTGTAADLCAEGDGFCRYPLDGPALLSNGSYSWTVTATNAKGSTTASDAPYTFVVDDTLPPRNFTLFTPTLDTIFRSAFELTEFTWRENIDAVAYDLFVMRISTDPARFNVGVVIDLKDITPEADDDALVCQEETRICTLTISDAQRDDMTTGLYAWTAIARGPGGGETEARNGEVRFSISTRDINLLVNGDFEQGSDPETGAPLGWALKNASADKLKCNKRNRPNGKPDKIFADDGECAFQFKGGEGERSKLRQNPAYDILVAEDSLAFGARVAAKDATTGARLKLLVRYTDKAIAPIKFNLDVPAGTYAYQTLNQTAQLDASGAIKVIKVQVVNKMTAGRLRVDGVYLDVQGSGEYSPLLPLPNAPMSYRSGR